MSCLVGIVDSKIHNESGLTLNTNKIGGSVVLPPEMKELHHPFCMLCGGSLVLIVQLYCPLEYSAFHRVLYVFACNNQQCWNKSESWVVYRCQTVDMASAKPKEKQTTSTGEELKSSSDDWGVEDADDWGAEGAGDWGTENSRTGEDDWGMESSGDLRSSTNGTMGGSNMNGEISCSSELPDVMYANEPDHADDIADDIPIQQMNLHDSVSDTDSNTDSHILPEDSHIIPEDSHIIPEDSPDVDIDRNDLKKLCEVASSSGTNLTIVPYYLNVFDEPANQEEDSDHVTKLLRAYEKKEGCRVYDTECLPESGKKGQVEGYERTSVYHKDLMFHKFMKRVSLCPQQCIRYEWNGTPLLIRELTPKDAVTRCPHCGGEPVFEFQLMPALVNHLRTTEVTAGAVVEFGTVLVFTCKQSCWDENDNFRTEQIIVQADPDQHLFN